jgi:hypothetical protein
MNHLLLRFFDPLLWRFLATELAAAIAAPSSWPLASMLFAT